MLVLNAVAVMDQLDEIRRDMNDVREFAQFNEGHRYTDFVAGTDHVAEYGIAALVAGGLAAKAGFFKGLLALLVAGKKFLIVAVVGIGAALKRLLSGRKSHTAAAAQPAAK